VIEKSIKKALNAKLNHWLESIDDEGIKEIVKRNLIITGGAFVSMLNNEEVNDYDVYFRTKEACKAVADYYVKKFNAAHEYSFHAGEENGRIKVYTNGLGAASDGSSMVSDEAEPNAAYEDVETTTAEDDKKDKPKYRPVWLSTNAITLSDKIQIVVRFYGEPDQIHENYDYVHCTCYWTSWDNHLELPARALTAIINKELYYMGSKYPLCSIIRSRKFIQRGWHINAGQYLKMCLQLNELNLKDIKVFEDQLIGVDSAYFSEAIRRIKEKQEAESSFKIDNAYLFEVVNRIF
jgi:hypothetical protein